MDYNCIRCNNLAKTNHILYNHLVLLVHRPEFPRRHPALGLEDAVEIGQVVEAAFVADFRDVPRRVDEHAGGVSQFDIDQIIGQRPPGAELKESAEGRRTHPHHVGQVCQVDRFRVVLVDILLHLQDAPTLRTRRRVRKRGTGQHPRVLRRGQLVEQQQKLQELPEAVLLRRERIEDVIHFHNTG